MLGCVLQSGDNFKLLSHTWSELDVSYCLKSGLQLIEQQIFLLGLIMYLMLWAQMVREGLQAEVRCITLVFVMLDWRTVTLAHMHTSLEVRLRFVKVWFSYSMQGSWLTFKLQRPLPAKRKHTPSRHRLLYLCVIINNPGILGKKSRMKVEGEVEVEKPDFSTRISYFKE